MRCLKQIATLALLISIILPANAQKRTKTPALTGDQRIVQVLNRIGFGVRPGDVERVKAMGLESYINQQLTPEKISDAVAENKVKDLTSLSMTTAELYEKYPQPGQLLRQLQARGMLPGELAEARENRVKGGANTTPGEMRKGDAMNAPEMKSDATKNNQTATPVNPLENKEYREVIAKYYRENGLQRPER